MDKTACRVHRQPFVKFKSAIFININHGLAPERPCREEALACEMLW
jgi:hypothetical protein